MKTANYLAIAREINADFNRVVTNEFCSLNAKCRQYAECAFEHKANYVRALLPQAETAKDLQELLKADIYSTECAKQNACLNSAGEVVPTIYLTETRAAEIGKIRKLEALKGADMVVNTKYHKTREIEVRVPATDKAGKVIKGKYVARKVTENYTEIVPETRKPFRKFSYSNNDVISAFNRLTAGACSLILQDAIRAREMKDGQTEKGGKK